MSKWSEFATNRDFDKYWNSLSFEERYWSNRSITPDDSRTYLEELYKHWTEVINFIPEVKPRKAKWALQDYCISNEIKPCEIYAGFTDWNLRMKPKGAEILLYLFEQGLIEQKTKNASKVVKNTAAFVGLPPPNRRNDPNRNWGLPE